MTDVDATAETLAALESVFRRLPSPAPEGKGIPYAETIPGIARAILLLRPVRRHQQTEPFGKGLVRVEVAASETVAALERLSVEAVKALGLRPRVLEQLTTHLRILAIKAREASRVRGEAGAPAKRQKRKIAKAVGVHYFRLTGRKPTVSTKDGKAYSEFLKTLDSVYKILGVAGGAEKQAREIGNLFARVCRMKGARATP